MVPEQYLGVKYRLVTQRLRISSEKGDSVKPPRVYERPRDPASGRFLDKEPVIVEFQADDTRVDVGLLLQCGAIVPIDEAARDTSKPRRKRGTA